jgi:excisionase family DNA binding protein
MDEAFEPLLTLSAAAARLGCGVKTLRRWLAEGALPAVAINPPGRRRKRWRVPERQLMRLLRERTQGAERPANGS